MNDDRGEEKGWGEKRRRQEKGQEEEEEKGTFCFFHFNRWLLSTAEIKVSASSLCMDGSE